MPSRNELEIAAIKATIASHPDNATAHLQLGIALRQLNRDAEALQAFCAAVILKPDSVSAIGNMGLCLQSLGRFDEALAAVQKVLQLQPNLPEAHANLGLALQELGKADEAQAAFAKAVELKPDLTIALSNLAKSLTIAGRVEEAIPLRRRAVELEPASAARHLDYGIALLQAGQFDPGWREYEYRPERKLLDQQLQKIAPCWDGSDPAGKTILLAHEQGFGDVIQFVRYAELISKQGGKVAMECQPELQRLLECLRSIDRLVLRGQLRPPFDFYCHIMSLGRIFKTNLENIPAKVPYLHASADLVEAWGQKLGTSGGRIRIGIAWAANPKNPDDKHRSIRLQQLSPLASVPNVEFFSLQKGEAAEQAKEPPPGMALIDFSADLTDFADTAALMSHLDLIICVDTSVAHLAGALGKPVWVMLPREPDWRWLMDRDDSPWYPTMRLLRQNPPGDRARTIQAVADALAAFKLV